MKIKSKKKLYIIFAIICIVITTLLVIGSIWLKNPKTQVLMYLNSKYDDTFKYTGYDECFDDNYKKMYYSSEKYPGYTIVGMYDTDTKSCFDNYVDVMYTKEIDKIIKSEILDKCLVDGTYIYDSLDNHVSDGSVHNYSVEVSLHDFIASKSVEVTVFVDNTQISDYDEIEDNLKTLINNCKANVVTVDLYFVDNFDEIKDDIQSTYNIINNKNYVKHLHGDITGEYNTMEYIWEE